MLSLYEFSFMLETETFEGLAEKRLLKLCESFKNARKRRGGRETTHTHTHSDRSLHTRTYNKGNLLITIHEIGWCFLAAGQKRRQHQQEEIQSGSVCVCGIYSIYAWYAAVLGLGLFCMLINYFQDFHSDMWKFKNSIWQLFHVIEPQLWSRLRESGGWGDGRP